MSEIRYRAGLAAYDLPVSAYPDGMPLLSAPVETPTAILVRPSSLGSLFAALCWVDALAERGIPVPPLVLPCVSGGRQDRINPAGDYLFTLKSVASAINARHFPSVTVLDPHSLVTPALIDRCVVSMPPFYRPDTYAGVIAPDAGAEKRALGVAQRHGVALVRAWKSRDVATGALTGFGTEPLTAGGHYLVVDDLCDAGGTFLGLAQVVAASGATADLFVTHGLFTKGTDALLGAYRSIYCTDSTLGEKPGVLVVPCCESLLLGAA